MNETTLDIRQIVKTLKKRKGLIGKIFFLFVVVAAVYSARAVAATCAARASATRAVDRRATVAA